MPGIWNWYGVADPAPPRWFVGLDLGQANDFSALAAVENTEVVEPGEGYGKFVRSERYACRLLKRWPLGTSYPAIVADVVRMLNKPPLDTARLIVDGTGCGRPVVDLLAVELPSYRLDAVTIVSGHTTRYSEGYYHVPKRELAAVLQVVLQHRTLTIAADPLRDVLVKEMANFQVKISAAGNELFAADWRTGSHDDLVLSLSLAVWRALAADRVRDDEMPLAGNRAGVMPRPRR